MKVLQYDWASEPRHVFVVCTDAGQRQFERDFEVNDGTPLVIPEPLWTPGVRARVQNLSRWPTVGGRVVREYNMIGST